MELPKKLCADEQREALEKIVAGTASIELRQHFLAHNLGIVVKQVNKLVSAGFQIQGQTVDDMIQDAALHLFNVLHKYDPTKGEFSTYAARVTQNTLLMAQRRSNAKKRQVDSAYLSLDDDSEQATESGRASKIQEQASKGRLSEDLVETKMLLEMLDNRLDCIDPLYRQILKLLYLDDMTHESVAEQIGSSRSQVTKLEKMARQELKDLMEKDESSISGRYEQLRGKLGFKRAYVDIQAMIGQLEPEEQAAMQRYKSEDALFQRLVAAELGITQSAVSYHEKNAIKKLKLLRQGRRIDEDKFSDLFKNLAKAIGAKSEDASEQQLMEFIESNLEHFDLVTQRVLRMRYLSNQIISLTETGKIIGGVRADRLERSALQVLKSICDGTFLTPFQARQKELEDELCVEIDFVPDCLPSLNEVQRQFVNLKYFNKRVMNNVAIAEKMFYKFSSTVDKIEKMAMQNLKRLVLGSPTVEYSERFSGLAKKLNMEHLDEEYPYNLPNLVSETLPNLTKSQQEVMKLRYLNYELPSFNQVADELNITAAAACLREENAVKRMKQMLEK
jgi:RNA polymerase sigma factor (sigma-70 family)